jgi:hypothetical protein
MAHHQSIEAQPVKVQRLVPALQGIVTEAARDGGHLVARHRTEHADGNQDQPIFAEVTQPRLERGCRPRATPPHFEKQYHHTDEHGKRRAGHHHRQAIAHHHRHDH